MFDLFSRSYVPQLDSRSGEGEWSDSRCLVVEGFAEFQLRFSGATFGGGLYRVHDDKSGKASRALVSAAFPEFANRVFPFAFDWLGRQFALDFNPEDGQQQQILILEVGTGEVLEIPLSFSRFHNEELVGYAEAALAVAFYKEWVSEQGISLPLGRDSCAGYKVPLFLGGQDQVANLELSDIDVYWSLVGQLRQRVLGLLPGASITGVTGTS